MEIGGGLLRRSPHGERGLKFEKCNEYGYKNPSLSSRRAWIEITCVALSGHTISSLSSRRAWIEIQYLKLLKSEIHSRSPHGERGLKSLAYDKYLKKQMSLSSRRAWIEINKHFVKRIANMCRSPHGERGLK